MKRKQPQTQISFKGFVKLLLGFILLRTSFEILFYTTTIIQCVAGTLVDITDLTLKVGFLNLLMGCLILLSLSILFITAGVYSIISDDATDAMYAMISIIKQHIYRRDDEL